MDIVNVRGQVGPQVSYDGADLALRLGRGGELVTTLIHGKHFETALRKNVFYAANQAAQAVSVALATTYTGLCLSNPAGSTVNLSILKVGYTLSVAPAAIAPMGLITGYVATGVTAHTAALTPASTYIGVAPTCFAKADSQATIVGSPAWTMMFLGGFTAAALFATSPAVVDVDGAIIIAPGGYVAIGALTAVTGFGSIMWEEIPI